MQHRRKSVILLALAAIMLLLIALPRVSRMDAGVPGLDSRQRTLLRIWVVSSPGGGQNWLNQQLREWQKQHPAVMTYLRSVTPDVLLDPNAIQPDILLFMPGALEKPAGLLAPVDAPGSIREELLRCCQQKDVQFAIPLCWGGYVLAIDSTLEPGSASTPAPAPLLGKPSAAAEPPGAMPYPLEAARASACPLQCPAGAALFSLCTLLAPDERPPLPPGFATLDTAAVYAAFRSRACSTAMLTTGQATAFTSLTSAGKGFPFRIMVPDGIVTDQVWLAGVTPDAGSAAEELLRFLVSADAQKALSAQGLHTVRDDLRLYSAGFSAETEAAGRRSLQAINAFLPAEQVHSAAWQAFQGRISINVALRPLL